MLQPQQEETKILGISKDVLVIGGGLCIIVAIIVVFFIKKRSNRASSSFSFPKMTTPTVTQKINIYPEFALTANNTKGYKASASSISSAQFDAYKAFDGILVGNSNAWSSGNSKYDSITGNYKGSEQIETSAGLVSGEWIQLDFPQPVALLKYTLYPRLGYESTRCPRNFVLLGSNGSNLNWTALGNQSNLSWDSTSPKTFDLNLNISYSSFRLVITRVGNDTTTFGKTNADISALVFYSYTRLLGTTNPII